MRVLKGYAVGGKSKNKIPGIEKIDKFNIYTNFLHYGMKIPDFAAVDIASLPLDLSGKRPIFDAIVCDPPYGVRARS